MYFTFLILSFLICIHTSEAMWSEEETYSIFPPPLCMNDWPRGSHGVFVQPHILNNWSLKWPGCWGWKEAELLWQTFPSFHLTFVVLLVVLPWGEACRESTGIQLTQMSPMREWSHGRRLRVHSLSCHNAWKDDNRLGVEGEGCKWKVKIRLCSSNPYKLLFRKGKAEGKKKKLQVTRIHICKHFNH